MKYILKHKDIDVLSFSFNEKCEIAEIHDIYNKTHAPVSIFNNENLNELEALEDWWIHRTIPASRNNLEEGLLRLNVSTTTELLKKSYGLSLDDHYWIMPENASLKWHDVNYYENDFSDDVGRALFDNYFESLNDINMMSPDNSSDGVLKKRWKIEADKTRVLIKGGDIYSPQESFNEVIAAEILNRLNIPHAKYSVLVDSKNNSFYSVTPNFTTDKVEFINAKYIYQSFKHEIGTINRYEEFISCCEKKGISRKLFEADLIKMFFVDYILANTDRHYRNFGFLRDSETLEWKGLAPVYDTGKSLFEGLADIDMENPYFMSSKNIYAKPFAPTQELQFSMLPVKEFCSGLPKENLNDINVFIKDVLKQNFRLSENRKESICIRLNERIKEAFSLLN